MYVRKILDAVIVCVGLPSDSEIASSVSKSRLIKSHIYSKTLRHRTSQGQFKRRILATDSSSFFLFLCIP